MRTLRRWGYPLVLAGVPATLLGVFAVVEALDVPLLTDPSPLPGTAGPAAAATGVGLLLVDVALPVPSSLVMVAHGVLFGVVAGAALSLVGGLGATLAAFGIGRRSRRRLARITTPAQRARADELLRRYGLLAVLLSRPVPVLAETVALLAGTSGMAWHRVALAGAAGTLPPAVLYAAAGAAGQTTDSTVGYLVLFGLTALTGLALRHLGRVSRRASGNGDIRARGETRAEQPTNC
ncbi:TVP38/TMEM64 family protein [Micromonospora sp. LZ34]